MRINIFTCLLIINLILTLSIYAEDRPTLNYQMDDKVANWSTGASYHRVILKPENFPQHMPLIFESQNLKQRILGHLNVFIDDQNRLIDMETKKEIQLDLGVYAKGEPIKCTLRTNLLYADNKQLSDSVYIVPRPIQAKDEEGHVLSLRLVSDDGRMFWMTAEGFEPLEIVEFCSISESEVRRHEVQMPDEGSLDMLLAPAVIGQQAEKLPSKLKAKTQKTSKSIINGDKRLFIKANLKMLMDAFSV